MLMRGKSPTCGRRPYLRARSIATPVPCCFGALSFCPLKNANTNPTGCRPLRRLNDFWGIGSPGFAGVHPGLYAIVRFADCHLCSDDAVAQGLGDRFGFRVDLQFVVDIAHVEMNGVERDAELSRGGFVVMTLDQKFQQPGLMRSQLVVFSLRRMDLAEQRHYAARN